MSRDTHIWYSFVILDQEKLSSAFLQPFCITQMKFPRSTMTKIAWVEKGGDKNSLAERKGGDKEKKLQQFHLLTLHKYLSQKKS